MNFLFSLIFLCCSLFCLEVNFVLTEDWLAGGPHKRNCSSGAPIWPKSFPVGKAKQNERKSNGFDFKCLPKKSCTTMCYESKSCKLRQKQVDWISMADCPNDRESNEKCTYNCCHSELIRVGECVWLDLADVLKIKNTKEKVVRDVKWIKRVIDAMEICNATFVPVMKCPRDPAANPLQFKTDPILNPVGLSTDLLGLLGLLGLTALVALQTTTTAMVTTTALTTTTSTPVTTTTTTGCVASPIHTSCGTAGLPDPSKCFSCQSPDLSLVTTCFQPSPIQQAVCNCHPTGNGCYAGNVLMPCCDGSPCVDGACRAPQLHGLCVLIYPDTKPSDIYLKLFTCSTGTCTEDLRADAFVGGGAAYQSTVRRSYGLCK